MLGWLHATPEGEKEPRQITEPEWPLPECGAFQYVVQWFIELRLNFGYTDIKAWSDLTGSIPNPVEVELLMSMTSVYSSSANKYRAKKYNMHPPYDGLTDKSELTKRRLSALFGD